VEAIRTMTTRTTATTALSLVERPIELLSLPTSSAFGFRVGRSLIASISLGSRSMHLVRRPLVANLHASLSFLGAYVRYRVGEDAGRAVYRVCKIAGQF